MSASVQSADLVATPAARRLTRLNRIDIVGLLITLGTLIGAIVWAFPLYWGLITTFKHEYEIVRPGVQLWPEHFTFENYVHVLLQTKIGYWYINSLITSSAVTAPRRDDGGGRRLRHLAAQFSRPPFLLVDDPRKLHGPDPGADRHPLHRHQPARPHQHVRRAWSDRSSSRR